MAVPPSRPPSRPPFPPASSPLSPSLSSPPTSPAGDEAAPAGQGSSRSGALMMCVAAGLVLVASLINGQGSSTDSARPPDAPRAAAAAPQSATSSSPRPAASDPPDGQPVGKHLPRSTPVRLRIPKIWVDAPFADLYLGPTGQL